jgi:outer membrane receptor protein involved in Fe transport
MAIYTEIFTVPWRLGATTTNELLLHGTAFSLTYDRLASGPALDYPTLAMGATYTAQHNREMRFQLRDNLSTLLSGRSGTHLAKCGLDVSWIQARFDGDFCKNGYFIFETDTSSLPVGGYVGFAPSHNVIPDWQFGLYAQDDWNPSSHLTLSLGLRYDLETNGANNGYRSPYADVLPFTSSDPRPIDWDNLGPRLGFAWDLQRDGRTVIRGGFGVFYDAYITQFESMEAQPTPYTWVSDPGTTDISQIPVNPDSILPGVIALAPTMETPMTRQYSLGMEHAFPGDWVVRADGIFIQGRNLPMQRSLNTYEFVDESTIVWRYPDFELVTQVLNRGEAETKMLILQLRKSFPQARIDLSYTLADRQATEDLIWSDYSPQVDPSSEDFSSDMGPVAWDERHRVVLAGQLRLPFGLNVGLAGIYASARPYNVVTGNDDNHDNVWNNDRPPGVGRNSERGPDYLNVDLSLKQVFRTSRGEVGLVANVYNLFNRTNYDARSVVINQQAASFGEPLGAYPKRQVEVGVELKY